MLLGKYAQLTKFYFRQNHSLKLYLSKLDNKYNNGHNIDIVPNKKARNLYGLGFLNGGGGGIRSCSLAFNGNYVFWHRDYITCQKHSSFSSLAQPTWRLAFHPHSSKIKTDQTNVCPFLLGGGGIRTHGTLARTTVFKTAPINRSGTPPSNCFECIIIIPIQDLLSRTFL